MRKLVYHVAMTLDNYICHPDGSIDGFAAFSQGEHVDDYLAHQKAYQTVVMGRRTYEFGYHYGLQPGQPAYPHMKHYIFSSTLRFGSEADKRVEVVDRNPVNFIRPYYWIII